MLCVAAAMTVPIYRLRDGLGKPLSTEIIDEEISNKWGLVRGIGVKEHMVLSKISFIKEIMCR